MLVPSILLLLTTLVSLFCIGLVYLSQNIRLLVRIYFSLAILFLISWIALLYFSNIKTPLVLLINRVVYVAPILTLLFLGLFIDTYYKRKITHRSFVLNIITTILALVGVGLASSPLNVSSVTSRMASGKLTGYSIVPGRLSYLVAAILIVLAAGVAARFLSAYKEADRRTKRPLRIILWALTITILVSLATNVLLPILIGGSAIADAVGNISVVLFVSCVAYSVLKYSFLNIRLLVIRSVGYVVSLGVILALISVLQVGLFSTIGGGRFALSTRQQLTLTLLFGIAALSFTPLRTLFAKLTSGFFFKGGYDSAEFITEFNNNLVRHIEMSELLSVSSKSIEKPLGATFCIICVNPTSNTPLYTTDDQNWGSSELEEIAKMGQLDPSHVLVKELIDRGDPKSRHFMEAASKYNIEVLVKLVASDARNGTQTGVGYIVLGPKKNGDVYNKTDVEVISIVANELVLAVQNALRFEEIERFNATLQQRIDDATRKLRHSNEKLRNLDQTKDDFISMASHQLRTPLTSVKGYVSMVLDGDAGPINPMQRKLLNQSFMSAQRMVYLIADLLNISRLKTGRFVIEPSPTSLAQITKDEVSQLVETAKSRGIELTYDKPQNFPTYMLDNVKTRQVIMNFVDNAIYYTRSGGHIHVELQDKPKSIELRVIDDGIGVPRILQHHLFTKFYRAPNAQKARPDGTGLGLFMAKKVILAQGGAIIFKSIEGKGSTFGLSFPKSHLSQPVLQQKYPS